MSFTSEYFIIDNIKSSDIGVSGAFIIRDSAEINRSIMGERDIVEESIPYRNEKTFYTTQSNNIELTLMISLLEDKFDNDMEFELGNIFAKNRYVRFESMDKPNIIYYVIAKSIEEVTYGNYQGWWKIELHTSAPYCYSNSVITMDFSDLTTPQTFTIDAKFNVMHPLYQEYVYFPMVNIDLENTNSFTMYNLSDDNAMFQLTGLTTNESIEVDNDLKKIKSSTGNYRLSNLTNKQWFRLVYGRNIIKISSPVVIQFICMFPIYI